MNNPQAKNTYLILRAVACSNNEKNASATNKVTMNSISPLPHAQLSAQTKEQKILTSFLYKKTLLLKIVSCPKQSNPRNRTAKKKLQFSDIHYECNFCLEPCVQTPKEDWIKCAENGFTTNALVIAAKLSV